MQIEHFGGSAGEVDNDGLDRLLDARFGNEANEYSLSGKERYPLLTIMVQGPRACLHFFPTEEHPGLISIGDQKRRDRVTFYTNSPSEGIEVVGSHVVTLEQARRAAHEFLRSSSLPASVEWFEL